MVPYHLRVLQGANGKENTPAGGGARNSVLGSEPLFAASGLLQKFSRGVRTKARLPAQQALSRGSDAADARVLLVRSPRRPQPAAAQPQLRPVPASAATETQSHLLQNRPQLPLRNQQDIKRQGGGMSRARPCRPHSQPLHSSNCDPSLRRRTETDGTKSSSPQTFAGNHHRTANVD